LSRSFSFSTSFSTFSKLLSSDVLNPFVVPHSIRYKVDPRSKFFISFNLVDLLINYESEILPRFKTPDFVESALYSVIVKLKYENDTFRMAGNQFGFKWVGKDSVYQLLDVVKLRISTSINQYGLDDDSIIYISLYFRKFDTKLLSEFAFDKSYKFFSVGFDNSEFVLAYSQVNENLYKRSL
jgi:hypothetical protein